MNRGCLVCVCGADASGKSTIINEYIKRFSSPAEKWIVYKYPNRSTPVGKKIDDILKGNLKVSKDVEIKLFADNRAEDRITIVRLLSSGVNIILDRYLYCSLAYTMTNQYISVMKSISGASMSEEDMDLMSEKFMFKKIVRHDRDNLKPDITILVYGNFLESRLKDIKNGTEVSEKYDYTGNARDVLYNNYIVSFLNTETKFATVTNEEDNLERSVNDLRTKIVKYAMSPLEKCYQSKAKMTPILRMSS